VFSGNQDVSLVETFCCSVSNVQTEKQKLVLHLTRFCVDILQVILHKLTATYAIFLQEPV